MAKNSFTFNFNSLPKGCLVFLTLVTLFEIALYAIPEHKFLNPPYQQIAMKLKGETADRGGSYDLIIIGDCTAWAGIRPIIIEKELGISAYNLSLNSWQTYLMNYVILNRYLQKSVNKPKVVLLQVSARSLLGEFTMDSDALRRYVLNYFRVDSDLISELDPQVRADYLKYRLLTLLPSVKRQYILRAGRWVGNLWKSDKAEYERHLDFFKREKGFFAEELFPNKGKIDSIIQISSHYREFNLNRYNVQYIKKILSLLAAHHIKTIVCTTPVIKDELILWGPYEIKNKLQVSLKSWVKDYDNVIGLWDMVETASNRDYFADDVHLNSKGAEIYTSELVKRIKEDRNELLNIPQLK